MGEVKENDGVVVVVVGARGSFKYIAFYYWAERHVGEERSSQFGLKG